MAYVSMRSPTRPVHPCEPVRSWDDLPIICTCADVARLFACGVEKVQRMAAGGELPAFKVGPEWRFRRDDVMAHIDRAIMQGAEAV